VEDAREIAERRAVTDALIAASPDAVVVADAARKIVAFNPAAERLYGRQRADVIGQGMGDLLIPERNRARFLSSTEEFLRSQDPGEYTGRMLLPILRSDGTERTVELTPLPLVVGGQTYFCNFARDVTELERANTALAASEARVRLLSELAPVGIARTDGAGTCAYVNERWCAQNGQLAAAILGTSWLESVHPGDLGSGGNGCAPGRQARSCAPTSGCGATRASRCGSTPRLPRWRIRRTCRAGSWSRLPT
jgi:PAS domain S-box-containing protein